MHLALAIWDFAVAKGCTPGIVDCEPQPARPHTAAGRTDADLGTLNFEEGVTILRTAVSYLTDLLESLR